MKEYFQWVVENCARVWDMPEDKVSDMILKGIRPVPEAFSLQIYIKEVLKQ